VLEETKILTLPASPRSREMTPALTGLFAFAVGLIVINLFAMQPLVGLVGPSLGLGSAGASLVSAAISVGYAAGLLLLVPLSDLVESRKLIVATLGANAAALALATVSRSAVTYLAASFLVGLTSSAIQMLIPVAAALSPAARRGRIIGNVMMGLMVGVLVSRPAGSLVADAFGWRAVDGLAAAAIAGLTLLLALFVPEHRQPLRRPYRALIESMWTLLREERLLQVRAVSSALAFASFSVFWTTVALRLAQPPFELGQRGIALFALGGVGGVVMAPLAGRAGDRGWTRSLTLAAHASIVLACIVAALAGTRGSPLATHRWTALGLMSAASILMDLGVVADQTLGRRAMILLRPEAAGRLNGLFTGSFFVGGAVGSAVAGLAWVHGGWASTCIVAATFALAAIAWDLLAGARGTGADDSPQLERADDVPRQVSGS